MEQPRLSLLIANSRQPIYFWGAGGLFGVAGCDLVCDGIIPRRTEFDPPPREAKIESVIDVTIKMMADQVVALESTVAEPRGPKAVWLPMPPNAAAMSPLLPLCSRTTMIRKKQTIIWTVVIRIIMRCGCPVFSMKMNALVRKGGFEPPRLSAPPPQDGVSASSTTSAGLYI